MQFFKKSIARKLIAYILLFGLIVGGGSYYLYSKGSIDKLSLMLVGIGLGVFALIFLGIYWFDVIRPMRAVLSQIQALISGKSYKRVYTTRVDEIGIIAHFFNQVTKGLGKVSFDLKDRDRMMDELTIASQLQRDVLPPESPLVPGLQVTAKNKPATEIGGDSFDIVTIKDKTYIYIGDVTGHGVAAGLIMTMVNSLLTVFADSFSSPYDILVHVNKYIKRHVKKAMYMTMVMLCWDHKTKKMTYVGAGHEHVLLYKAATGVCEAILSGGVALGMVPDNSKLIQEKELKVEDGDFVVIYTDGITEARNKEGELYGLERLKKSVVEYASQYSADGVNYHIAKDVSDYMGGHTQDDDMTLIVMKKTDEVGRGEAGAKSTKW